MTPAHSSDPATIADHLKPIIDRELALFQSLKYSATAAPNYELLSDAVYWDDEVPTNPSSDVLAVMRYLLRTRIDIAQHGSSTNDPTWNTFKRLVATWPGFRPERCGAAILAIYAQGRSDRALADE